MPPPPPICHAITDLVGGGGSNFTTAFFYTGPEDDIRKKIMADPSFAAPEVQLRDVLTPACDVWALGCVLHHVFSNDRLWMPLAGHRNSLVDLTLCFGKLPDPWWSAWPGRGRFFNSSGCIKHSMVSAVPTCLSISQRIATVRGHREAVHGMGGEEYRWFQHMLHAIFHLLPAERASIHAAMRYLPPRWLDEVEREETGAGR